MRNRDQADVVTVLAHATDPMYQVKALYAFTHVLCLLRSWKIDAIRFFVLPPGSVMVSGGLWGVGSYRLL